MALHQLRTADIGGPRHVAAQRHAGGPTRKARSRAAEVFGVVTAAPPTEQYAEIFAARGNPDERYSHARPVIGYAADMGARGQRSRRAWAAFAALPASTPAHLPRRGVGARGVDRLRRAIQETTIIGRASSTATAGIHYRVDHKQIHFTHGCTDLRRHHGPTPGMHRRLGPLISPRQRSEHLSNKGIQPLTDMFHCDSIYS